LTKYVVKRDLVGNHVVGFVVITLDVVGTVYFVVGFVVTTVGVGGTG
jgi:hypothetical protein